MRFYRKPKYFEKNNTEENRANVMLLSARFCAYFSLQIFKNDDKYMASPEFLFALPPPSGCVGLATALRQRPTKLLRSAIFTIH